MKKHIWLAIFASALGFFVDIYDIIIFSIVRTKSLLAVGIPEAALLEKGVTLYNIQMAGMLLGGFIWGIIGDRYGRLSVLFGSIILYSTATFANAYAPSFEWYFWLRFIAGVGLAGELGAAITLVTEQMPQKFRGIGPSIIGGFGMIGAIAGAYVGGHYSWQFTYQLGGAMGIVLLFLRLGVLESGLFHQMKEKTTLKGDLRLLFNRKRNLKKYASICLLGFPVWFSQGVIMTFTPEIARAWGMIPIPAVTTVFTLYFTGLTLGNFSSGLISQYLKSRKATIQFYLLVFVVTYIVFFISGYKSTLVYVSLIGVIGFGMGYMIVLLTLAAEQFGTNLRATVTTSSLNLIRAASIPQTLLFGWLLPHVGAVYAAMVVFGFDVFIALYGFSKLEETFGKELNFTEK